MAYAAAKAKFAFHEPKYDSHIGSFSNINIYSGINILDGEFKTGWINNNSSIGNNKDRLVSANYNRCEGGKSYYINADYPQFRAQWYDVNKNVLLMTGTLSVQRSVPAPVNAKFVRVAFATNSIDFANLNYPSTVTTKQDYATKTIIQLGRNVYGGSLDITSGVLTVTHQMITFDGSSDEEWAKYYQQAADVITFRIPMTDKVMEELTSISNNFTNIKNCWTLPDEHGVFSDHKSYNLLYFRPFTDDITEVADWRAWLAENPTQVCYKLATPVTYQLTPMEIKSVLGINNIWCNTGNTSVTYYADPDITPPLLSMLPPPIDEENP